MPLTEKEKADLKKLIKDRADNYPDLGGMVAAGNLSYKAGWYEAKGKEAYDCWRRPESEPVMRVAPK